MDWNGGEEVFVDHVEIGPTRFTYVGKYPDTASSLAPLVFFRMKDGQILTRKQMGMELEMLGEVQMKEQLYPFSIEVGEGGAEYAGPYAASM